MRTALLLSSVVAGVVAGIAVGAAACGFDAIGAVDSMASGDADQEGGALVDGAGVLDASALDASSAGDASPVAFCAGQTDPAVSYCWDFETPATSIGTFDPQETAGTISVISAGGSQAMSITLPIDTASRDAWVKKAIGPFVPGATTYEIRYRFAITETTLEYAVLGGFRDSNGAIFGVASYGTGASLGLSVTAPKTTLVSATAGPTWHTAVMMLEAQAPSPPTGQLTIDGTAVFDNMTAVASIPILELRLGAYYTAGTTGGCQILFDDVLVLHH